MRVFVAGATGAIVRYLVPRLIRAGHPSRRDGVPARAKAVQAA